MDKKKALLNVAVSIFFKIALLILALLSKRFLIKYVGNEANGLFALYTSIVGILSVAELGIGIAISFSMYKPITENDNDKVSALYHLFVKLYNRVASIILFAGLIIMPFLPYLTKEYTLSISIYASFLLMLISSILTYLFAAKSSLLNAYKNNYIDTAIFSSSMIVCYILQIIFLKFTSSFYLYLLARIIYVIIQWILLEITTKNKYNHIIKNKTTTLDENTKAEISKNIKALFMHRIGGAIFSSIDGIIISALLGVSVLGKYSNYTSIINSMTAILILFFTPLTSVVGHFCVKGDTKQEIKYFNFFYTINLILGFIFFLGFYAVIDDLILLLFGNNLSLSKTISYVFTLCFFIQFMRQSLFLFKDSTGVFYQDRWKCIIESIANVVLSLILGKFFGVVGIILATIITNLLICGTIEPHVLYKYTFKQKPYKYYIKNYLCIILFASVLLIESQLMFPCDSAIKSLIINGLISLAISLPICLLICIFNKNFKEFITKIFSSIKNKLFKKNS